MKKSTIKLITVLSIATVLTGCQHQGVNTPSNMNQNKNMIEKQISNDTIIEKKVIKKETLKKTIVVKKTKPDNKIEKKVVKKNKKRESLTSFLTKPDNKKISNKKNIKIPNIKKENLKPYSELTNLEKYKLSSIYYNKGDFKNFWKINNELTKKGYNEAIYDRAILYKMGKAWVEKSEKKWKDNILLLARKNFIKAQRDIITHYLQVENNIEKATYWLKKLANKGDVASMNILGYINIQGQYKKVDIIEAKKWFSIASKQNNSEAKYNLGVIKAQIQKKPDYKGAIKLFKEVKGRYESKATFNLGYMYLNGIGTKEDYNKAFKYMLISANLNESEAQYNLARMYAKGIGVVANSKESTEWLQKSAQQGNKRAIKVLKNISNQSK